MAVSAEEAVRAVLLANAAVNLIVGTKIRPFKASQDETGFYLCYQRIASPVEHHMGGATGVRQVLIQINGYAQTKAGLHDLRDKVRLALDGKPSGLVTVGTNSLSVHTISLQDDRDQDALQDEGEDASVFGFQQDYLVWHAETVPTF